MTVWPLCPKLWASETLERQQDITLGAIFVALGIAAAWGATSYKGAGGIYPMVLGLLLALFGLFVAFRAVRASSGTERPLMEAPVNLATTVLAGIFFVALVVPLGFYTASFLLMLGLPLALGFRRLPYTVIVGAVFIGIVYLVFSILLEKPLPREWFLTAFGSG
ncbi:tripartite tricarboxylate transporter TctB family protein [Planktotalea arctica]|uniref:tripartite tricarboxylate transporter TctB family protein n=1 Tax=Planktotalea arctica TaxID=1481893 RepID=UPI00321AAD8A